MYIDIKQIERDVKLNMLLIQYANVYKENIKRNNSIATGELYNFKYNFHISNQLEFEIEFALPKQWEYVEYGRRPGKCPPIRPILEWLKVKKIIPHRSQSKKSLAFAISKSIGRKGIRGKHLLEKSLNSKEIDFIIQQIKSRLNDLIISQVTEQIENEDIWTN